MDGVLMLIDGRSDCSIAKRLETALARINHLEQASTVSGLEHCMHKEPPLPVDCACVKCGIDRRLVVAHPCAHLCLCPACRSKLESSSSFIPCPVCHKPVTNFQRVY